MCPGSEREIHIHLVDVANIFGNKLEESLKTKRETKPPRNFECIVDKKKIVEHEDLMYQRSQ